MAIPCGGGFGKGVLKRGNYGLFLNFKLLLIQTRMHLQLMFRSCVDP